MAESERRSELELDKILKPFFQSASQAEDRLARLEAALGNKKDSENEEHLKTISELQSKLEKANAEIVAGQQKAEKLAAENERLQYRIVHLLRTAKEANHKLESKCN